MTQNPIEVVVPGPPDQTLVDALIDAVAALGGVALELPARTEIQRSVTFD